MCTGTGVVFQGFTVVWFIISNVHILPEISSLVSGNWAIGGKKNFRCNFLLGQFLKIFDKIAVIHDFFIFLFTLLYRSLKQRQYHENKITVFGCFVK